MTAYTFDQLITFTRTSAATYVGSNGLVAVTPASRNLLTYTQDFDNAAWTKSNASAYSFDPATATYGAELVTNGNFSGGATGWTLGDWVISGGQASATATSTSLYGGQFTPVAGRVYRVEFDIISYASGTLSVTVGGNFTTNANLTGAAAAPGRKSVLVTAGSNPARAVEFYGGSVTATIDNISVREVIGGLIAAPDGTPTGDALVATAGTGLTPRVADTSNPTTINAAAYTASIYVRAGTYTFFQIYINNQGSEWANFTLTGAGTASANGSCTATITALSGGWYRCTMSYTAGGTDRRPFFMLAASGTATRAQTWNPTGTESILIWGAQLEAASAASTYTRNNGGVYPPRFDYDPVTRAPRGLLIEEQRTNLLLRSEEFDNASWVKASATVTANAAVSPDGTMDADKVIVNNGVTLGTGSAAGVRQTNSKSASATTYAYSTFLKVGEFNRAFLFMSNSPTTASARALFDLAAGTVSAPVTVGAFSGASAAITPFGNGWYRCTLIATSDADPTIRCDVFPADSVAVTGDGTSGIYLWGAQLEVGAFATSYIPTVASQVTRTADVAAITAPMFAPWYRQSEGTLVVKLTPRGVPSGGANVRVLEINDGGANNRNPLLYASSAGSTYFQYRVGGVDQAGLSSSAGYFAANTTITVASAYAANDFAASFSGSAATTDNSGSVATNATQMTIGYATSAPTEVLCGHIQSIDYYPTRLTNAQIQALTA